MDKLKLWLAISLVALLAIAAGGWSLLISPERSEAADLREQAEAEQLTNDQLETQLQVLRARAQELPAKRAELVAVAQKLPAGPSLPELVRAFTATARDAGVALTALTPGAPVPLAAAVPAAPVAPVEGTEAPAAAAPAAPAASGLSEVPVVLEVAGDFYELEQFLALLEDLPRAVRVTALAVQAEEGDGAAAQGTLRSTVTASAYMTAAPSTGAAPAAPPAAPVVEGAAGTTAAAPAPATGPATSPAAGSATSTPPTASTAESAR